MKKQLAMRAYIIEKRRADVELVSDWEDYFVNGSK